MPRDPDVFGKPTRSVRVEHLVDDAGDVAHRGEGHARLRVEVDPQLVGVVDVGAADRPRVQVEAAEVDGPDDVGDVDRAQLVGGTPAREVTRTVSSHSGRFSGTRFWKNGSPSAPSGKRFSTVGRSNTPRSAPGPTAR